MAEACRPRRVCCRFPPRHVGGADRRRVHLRGGRHGLCPRRGDRGGRVLAHRRCEEAVMGLFFGPRASTRSTYVVPPSSFDGGRYNAVDLSRAEASLQKVAVWSAVDLIVSLVSELPVDVYRGSGAERVQVRTPAWLLDPAGN